jgi:hypothetical protein
MAMVANDPKAAKRVGIPQSVGEEFTKADTGRKFAKGGAMKEDKAMEKRHVAAMKKAGVPKKIVAEEQAEANAMKCGGKVKKMAAGGLSAGHKSADGIAQKGRTKAKQVAMKKGGKVKC